MIAKSHPPYTVNLAQEGFDDQILGRIPDSFKAEKDWKEKLGHFWYADKAINDFISTIQKKYPDSLFTITGDHADRMNIEPSPSLYERYAVPFVLYGKGVNKSLLPATAAGTHLSIAPTIIELIAPKGFEYYSLNESLTKDNTIGANHEFWISSNTIGKIGTPAAEELPNALSSIQLNGNTEKIKQYVDSIRATSWWRIKKGQSI